MKTLSKSILTSIIIILVFNAGMAQFVSGFNYQAVVRNSDGTIMKNTPVSLRATISNDDGNIFEKTYNISTNEFGLLNVVIGKESTDFNNIDWSNGKCYLHIEIDTGSGFTDMGTSTIYPVPMANLAKDVINNDDADANPNNELQTLSISGDQLTISSGNTVTLPTNPGDQWGSQVVQSNNTLSGDGTTANPLSVNNDIITFERKGNLIRQKGNYDTDDFIFGREALPANGESISDTLLFFDKSKGAFRAGVLGGTLNSNVWAPDSIGEYSFATGHNTKASGNYSTAMGSYTTASGSISTAMGVSTTASGNYSTAMGSGTNASGSTSFAMGLQTNASAWCSIASGIYTTASGNFSTAMGHNTTASGSGSTAMGYKTTASGDYSIAMGYRTTAPSGYEIAIGQYNTEYSPTSVNGWDYNDRLFVIGNGSSPYVHSNALILLKKGFLGLNTYNNPKAELDIQDSKDTDGDVCLNLRSNGYNNDAIIKFYEHTNGPVMSLHYDGGDNALYIYDLSTHPDTKRLKIDRTTGSITPGQHKKADLGTANLAFDDIYYDDLHNQGASAFLDRSPAKEIISYPPRGKSKQDFDYKTERGDVELDPKSLPPGLSDENSLLTDEMVSYNYKTNYEQQIIIEKQKQIILEQDKKIRDLQKQNAEILKRLEALEKK